MNFRSWNLDTLPDDEFRGLAWRVDVPERVEVGKKIPFKLSIENVARDEDQGDKLGDDEIVGVVGDDLSNITTGAGRKIHAYRGSVLTRGSLVASIKLVRVDDGSDVDLTPVGAFAFYRETYPNYLWYLDDKELEPGERLELDDWQYNLAELYDLTEPGIYELTFYTRRFCEEDDEPAENPVRDYPQATSVRFTIVPRSENAPDEPTSEDRENDANDRSFYVYKNGKISVDRRLKIGERYGRPWTVTYAAAAGSYRIDVGAIYKKILDDKGLTENPYYFANREEATAEFRNPRPVPIPTNADIWLRGVAAEEFLARPGKGFIIFFKSWYEFYLNTIISERSTEESSTVSKVMTLDNEKFKNLAWKVSVPDKVETGEAIPLKVGVVNASSDEVSVSCLINEQLRTFYLNSIVIRRVDDSRVVKLTAKGARDYFAPVTGFSIILQPVATLKPGDYYEFLGPGFDLAENYDLSEPGEYELVFYTRQYHDENMHPLENQERKYPRKSTVRFTVLPKAQ